MIQLIGLLWGSSRQPCYCRCCRKCPHLKCPFDSACNCKISLNFTGQFKRGTWASVSRWVKLLKRYCLIFIYPLTSSPDFYSNKCRYPMNWFFIVCIWMPTSSHIFLTQPLKLWSAHLRWRKSLPPQLLHPPKKSPPQSWPRRSLSLRPLLPRCLLKKIRAPSSWRITSHIWDPSLVLTTGSSTPPEESLVWYSTDELARLLIYVHTTPVLLLF